MSDEEREKLQAQLRIANKAYREAAAKSHEAREEWNRIWNLLHPQPQYGDWGELA